MPDAYFNSNNAVGIVLKHTSDSVLCMGVKYRLVPCVRILP